MIETISFNGIDYPKFQSEGNAAKYAIPFASELCKGKGLDIGCMRKEWAFPGSTPIDKDFPDEWDAYHLPPGKFDYIFSSHCLEHLENWVAALDYWTTKLKSGAVLFLYLPHYDQGYWRPWNNRKHIHALSSELLTDYLNDRNKFHKIFCSGKDLNDSFYCIAEKK
jgi:SAM-dependent methyltransferase